MTLGSRWRALWARAHAERAQRWAEALDFSGRPPPAAWWSWGVLALGALMLMALSFERDRLSDELVRAEARLRQAQRFEQQLALRMQRARASSADDQQRAVQAAALNEQTLRAATRLMQQLAYPWGDVLAGIEGASGEVALLGLRHDTQGGEVHLEAAVRDDLSALQWLDALAADRGRFAQAYLQSREPLQQPVGEWGTRVQAVAVLSPHIGASAAEGTR